MPPASFWLVWRFVFGTPFRRVFLDSSDDNPAQKKCLLCRSDRRLKKSKLTDASKTDNKIYCVYIAPNEELLCMHARRGGFPANRISEVRAVIDPDHGGIVNALERVAKVVATGLLGAPKPSEGGWPVHLSVAVHIRETAHRAVATTASLRLLFGQSPE